MSAATLFQLNIITRWMLLGEISVEAWFNGIDTLTGAARVAGGETA